MPIADIEALTRGSSINMQPPAKREVAFALVQAAAGHVHRHQTRRARRVDGDGRSAEAQCVTDASRRHAEGGTGVSVRFLQGARAAGHQRVVVVSQTHEDTCRRARQCRRVHPGVLHSLPGCFEEQPVLRVDRSRLAVADPEELRIEACDIVEKSAPLASPSDPARLVRGRRGSRHPSAPVGISVIRSSPRSSASHNESGESMPPGSRHAIPTTATGVTA